MGIKYELCYTCDGEGWHDDKDPPRDTKRVRCDECGGGRRWACCGECGDHITGSGTVVAGDLDHVAKMLREWPNDLDAGAWMRAYECVAQYGKCPNCVAVEEEERAQLSAAAARSASVRVVECEDRSYCVACERTIYPRDRMLAWPGRPRLEFCDDCRQNIARAVAS